MQVLSFDQAKQSLLETSHGEYLIRYLSDLGCRTSVIEAGYVDREYLIDYCSYYARSFRDVERLTERLHFFAESFSEEDFTRALTTGDVKRAKPLLDTYLGFVVKKPLDVAGKRLVGRTVLRHYPREDRQDTRQYIETERSASLYGLPLRVRTLPYQTQDATVGACASTALWVSLYALQHVAHVPLLALAEITQRAVEFPGEQRRFPSGGLQLSQMLSFINHLDLDVEVVKPIEARQPSEMIVDFVKAFIRCGLPVIAMLKLAKPSEPTDRHAAVISGYRADPHGKVTELYVHDDQIGPYSRTLPYVDACSSQETGFLRWKNEWSDVRGYRVTVEKLITPVYPKIRLPFSRIYRIYLDQKEWMVAKGYDSDLFLTLLNPYKYSLLCEHLPRHRLDVLTQRFPRFLWVIRLHYKGRPVTDFVYDGTRATPHPLRTIQFDLDG